MLLADPYRVSNDFALDLIGRRLAPYGVRLEVVECEGRPCIDRDPN